MGGDTDILIGVSIAAAIMLSVYHVLNHGYHSWTFSNAGVG